MTTATHTPGPWQYAFEGGTTAFIVESDGSTVICIRTTENTTAHRNLASNARLIAAAPELLDALLDALPYVEDVLSDPVALACFKPGTVQRHAAAIRAAIARATGAA